jgi:uncharacterized metal-binding protein YceD (DUF177 family)
MRAPEFSRPLRLGTVGPSGRQLHLQAEAGEREALARRFDLHGIEALTASLDLRPEPGGTIRVRGRLLAEVVQSCVVTLEPVATRVDAPLDLRLLPDGQEPADEDPDSPDEIESPGDVADLGEALAEQLALALDPYPRAPGAQLPEGTQDAEEPETAPARPNPFAALKSLKPR